VPIYSHRRKKQEDRPRGINAEAADLRSGDSTMTMRWPWLLGRPHVRVASRHVTSDRGRRTRALEKRAAHSRPDARYAYAATLDQLPALQEAMYSLRSDFLVVRAKQRQQNQNG
jgi:hypothetical protein